MAKPPTKEKAAGKAKAKVKAKAKAKGKPVAKPPSKKAACPSSEASKQFRKLVGLARSWIGKTMTDEDLGPAALKFAKKIDNWEEEAANPEASEETLSPIVKALSDDLARLGIRRWPQ